MKIESEKNVSNRVQYGGEAYEKWIAEIEGRVKTDHFNLILLVGESKKKKQDALDEIKKQTDRDFYETDANELISANEAETCLRMDELFESFDTANSILHVINGANLCGAFTGYTLSKIKYATPQERYFLKKIEKKAAFVIIEFESLDHIDTTLKRASQSIITFKVPDSGIKGFIARLKQVHVNGFDLNSKRPVREGRSAGNF